jgi:serine/threonine protein kinase
MPLETGVILNQRYRILSILGQGGMGAVYHAIDLNLGVDVALKENLYLSEEFARQFKREAVMLATLKHPNLPRVSDHFEIKNRGQYLVMDYMDGEDLRSRMDRSGVLSDTEAVTIGATICDALNYLHSRQPAIIHRDLKPGNIRIAEDGRISLVDFGLAKVDMGTQETTTGARAMTPGYSPPEQYGQARTDPRSDIYSLGATLYAALCGCIPEDSLSRVTGYARLASIRKHNPRVSKKLAAVIEKAMDTHPENRYQTALEMKKALLASIGEKGSDSKVFLMMPTPAFPDQNGSASKNLGIKSIPVTFPPSPSKSREPFLLLKMIGITAIVLFTVAAATSIILINVTGILNKTPTGIVATKHPLLLAEGISPTPTGFQGSSFTESTPTVFLEDSNAKSALATLLAPQIQPSSTSQAVPGIKEDTPALPSSVDGPLESIKGEIAFVSMRTGIPQIWLINTQGESLSQVTNLKQGACQPDWSPDGQKLVFISPCYKREYQYPKANLHIIDADGSNPVALDPGYGGNYDPAWSPDGQQIAFTKNISGSTQVFIYNIGSKTISAAADAKEPSKHPAWSSDGKYLAYISTRYSSEIWVRDNLTGTNVQISHSRNNNDNWPVWSPTNSEIIFTQSPLDPFFPWLAGIVFPVTENSLEFKIPTENHSVPSPASDADISPDGKWLVFEAWPEGNNHDIYIMTMSGEKVVRLTDADSLDFQPAWRP